MKESMHGHGAAGRYLGITEDEAPFASSKVIVLPVPFDQTTTYISGAEKGPAALIEASRNVEYYDAETDSEPFLTGIYTASPLLAPNSAKMIEVVHKKVSEYLELEKMVILIGGEHAVSQGSIRAHAETHGPLSIWQFDAHTD